MEKATTGSGLRRRVISIGVAVLLYCVLASLAFAPVVPWSSTQVFGCACYDTPQQIWFMSWVPHLLTSGGNPFYANVINAPSGANMLVNTSMMLISALLAPVTLFLGPVSALNVGMRLAFAASALSAFAVLRKWRLCWPAAFVGGLLYGFSPYMIGQASGHLQMAFVVVPPLWLFVWERFLSRSWSARRTGLWLGCLAIMQFFIAIDVLSTIVVMTVAGLLVMGLARRSEVRPWFLDVLRMVGWSALVAVPLLAVPAFYTLAGPGTYSGPPQPLPILDGYRADLLSLVVPTSLQRFGPSTWISLGSSFGDGDLAENGEYLGIPLLVAVMAVTVWRRRSALVVALAGIGGVAFLLTLGTSLSVAGHTTWLRMPFDVISHLPLLRDQEPLRYSLYIQLAAAFLLAVGVDRVVTRLREWRPDRRRWLMGAGALSLVCAAAAAPLWPAVPYGSSNADIPAFFTTAAVQRIPVDSNVLVYPYPAFPYDQAMMWQASAGLRFRLIGGYIYNVTPSGTATLSPPTLSPSTVEAIFSDAVWGIGVHELPPGVSEAAAASAFRIFLARYHVGTVIVDRFGAYPETVAHLVTQATGEQPESIGGVQLWRVPTS